MTDSLDRWLLLQKFGLIGDAVFHLQAIHSIAAIAPRQCLTLGMPHPEPSADLFVDDPAVEGILKIGHGVLGRLQNIPLFAKENFARAYLLGRSTAHAFTFLGAGIRERLAYGYDRLQRVTLTRALYRPLPLPIPQIAQRSYDFMKAQGIPFLPEGQKPVFSPARLRGVLHQYTACPRPWIALGIGASVSKRLWPNAHWATLVQELCAHYGAGTIFLCGGWKDRERAQCIVDNLEAPQTVVYAIGEHLASVGCLFHYVDLFVGNDSGLLNLAGVIDASPVAGLFGVSPVLTYLPRLIAVTPPDGQGASSMESLTPSQVGATILQKVPKILPH
ncbi:MAG: hypothetical protein LBJ70_01120 [Holosporales bacterium]|jgi:heptosyltransferase-2|nr:hypothetical protein [Holosporales bacterium]